MLYFPILKFFGSTLEAIGLGSVGCELLRIESYLGKPLSEREVRLLEKPWLLHFSHHLLDSNFLPLKLRKKQIDLTSQQKNHQIFVPYLESPTKKPFVEQRFWIPSIGPLGQGCFIPVSQIVPQFTFDVEVFRGVFLPFFFPRYYWLGFLKITEQLEESGMNWTHGWHSWKFNLYIISTICLPTASTSRWLFFSCKLGRWNLIVNERSPNWDSPPKVIWS